MTIRTAATEIGGLLIAIALIIVIANAVFGAVTGASDAGETLNESVTIESGSGTIGDSPVDEVASVDAVEQSLGFGANISGPASTYTASDLPPLEPPYEVSMLAATRRAGQDQALYTYDEEQTLMVWYNSSSSEYRAYLFNTSSRDSYRISVPALTPGRQTVITVRHNGTGVTMSRNTTRGDGALTTGGTASAPTGQLAWNGTQDEFRVFNATLTATQRQSLVDTPTAPLPASDVRARALFDGFGGTATSRPLWFTSGTVDLSTTPLTETVPGQVTNGDDYSLSGDTITASTGSTLDGNPVAFVTYTAAGGPFQGVLEQTQRLGATALTLFVVGALVLAARELMNSFGGGF